MWRVIDENAEIIGTIEEGSKIISAKTIDYLKRTLEIDSRFLKVFTTNDEILFKLLTNKKGKIDTNTITLMRYLYKFIGYENGILQHENGKLLTVKYITDNLNMNSSAIFRSLKILKENKIIIKSKHKGKHCLIFNPFLVSSGKRIEDRGNFIDTDFAKNLE